MIATALILAYVTVERLGELVLANRNTGRLLARGGREAGAGHYPIVVAVHAAWLAGLWVLAWGRDIAPLFLALYVVVQGLRVWVLATLGRRWTTRIIVVPGETLVTSGPYRYVRHPNYWVVTGEIACLPLVFGLVWHAAIFSVLNGLVLAIRIRAEGQALRAI